MKAILEILSTIPMQCNITLSVNFICNYAMAWYPFDTQLCSMDLEMEENDKMFVDLHSDMIGYAGPVDLALYYIKRKSIKNEGSMVRVEITLGRRILSTVLTVYVPTFLLNVIALATNYFKAMNMQT